MAGRVVTNIFDAIVVGAGPNGIYQLHRLREAGLNVITLEAGSGVGGTWYWNRYPGARLDSECYAYTYAFSSLLIEEWDWTEEFADQPTLERYFNFVVDRLDLRRSIVFDARVVMCEWQEDTAVWYVKTADNREFFTHYLVPATGIMAIPYMPDWEGINDFTGVKLHSADWPDSGVDFTGKRVAVVGVGSTGIQIIQTIAPKVEHLTVLQRTPNWAAPLANYTFTPERIREVKDKYIDYYDATQASRSCFLWSGLEQSAFDVSADEREAYFAELYNRPGMALYQNNYRDILSDVKANNEVTKFLASKIAERVKDPVTARKLTPKHAYATKRPPLETGYYETYNRANVDLVALPEEPIVRLLENGIQTTERFFPVDVLIVATGFDAITGSFLKLGIHGVGGKKLTDAWADGPRTFMGVFGHDFPNMLVLGGPQGSNGNHPRCTTFVADWIVECILYLRANGVEKFDLDAQAEQEWVDYCTEIVMATPLLRDAENWQWGSNIPGKKRAYMLYVGSQPDFRTRLNEIAAEGYPQLHRGTAAAAIGGRTT
jgi:cation diffusion facilitator CzcD-associated flavoprotein CzcO